jgi:hypothetical protein
MGVTGQRHAPAALYSREKRPQVSIVQEAGWAPEPVWTQRLEEKSFRLWWGSNLDRPVVQSIVRQHLFLFMRRDYVSELLPRTDILFIPRMICVKSHGAMILTGEDRRNWGKTCPNATLSTTNPTLINPGLRGERPATNHLSHVRYHTDWATPVPETCCSKAIPDIDFR